jgi:hypothetical protein
MGNLWRTPLSELDIAYDAGQHPICAALLEGGPAALAQKYGLTHDDGYIDECHMCWMMRRKLIDRFPDRLAPRQAYGIVAESQEPTGL